MARACVFISFLLALSAFTLGESCVLAVTGGGCPNVAACMEVCQPCYRGVGRVIAFCRSAGGDIPFDECVCSFKDGAPCDPIGPPTCPGPWPPSQNV